MNMVAIVAPDTKKKLPAQNLKSGYSNFTSRHGNTAYIHVESRSFSPSKFKENIFPFGLGRTLIDSQTSVTGMQFFFHSTIHQNLKYKRN